MKNEKLKDLKMSKYRKKPVVIEAVKFDGTDESVKWLLSQLKSGEIGRACNKLYIKTLEGVMEAKVGDYVIKGVNGEFYPCKPDIFEKTYEKIEDDDLLNEKPIFFEDLKNGYTKAYTKSDIDMLIKYNKRLKEELLMERTLNEAEFKKQLDISNEVIKYLANLIK